MAAVKALAAADVDQLSDTLAEYFGFKWASEVLEAPDYRLSAGECSDYGNRTLPGVRDEWDGQSECEDGWEIVIADLPEGVTRIRVMNCY